MSARVFIEGFTEGFDRGFREGADWQAEYDASLTEAARVVFAAWGAFRRSQEIPWPMTGGGEVLKAQSRLFRLAEPYASGREPVDGTDLGAIQAATADLAAKVRRYCGDQAGAYVSGSEGQAAA